LNLPLNATKEAFVLVRSLLPAGEGDDPASRSLVVAFDRIAGPYVAILKARGTFAEIEQLAVGVGAASNEVCWLQSGPVREGGAST